MANNSLTDTDKQQISRWRLILGEEAEDALKDTAPECKYGGLSEKQVLMDQTLSAIYGSRDETFSNSRSAGNKKSSPVLSKWLGNLRSLFDNETVVVVATFYSCINSHFYIIMFKFQIISTSES